MNAAVLATLSLLLASSQPLSAPDAVRRWVEATGGKAALKRLHDVRVRGELTERGVPGEAEEWLSADGYRRTTQQDSDQRVEVCDRKTCWVRDWNGKVAELAGRDLADQRAVAHLRSLLYAGRMARSRTEAILVGDDESHERVVLRFSPPGGAAYDLHIDKSTSLPTKAVRRYFGADVTIEIEDWRELGGVRVPFLLRETEGDDDATVTVVREVAASMPPAVGSFARPEEGPRDFRFASGDRALAIPFNFENDHIMIDVSVNGSKPIWFMLDTGAESNYVNKTRLEEFGLTPFGASSVSGGGNSTELALTRVDRLDLGGAELLGQRHGVVDLTGLEKIYGRPMGGLLGHDFFSRFIVEIDYEKSTMSLYDPATYAYAGGGAPLRFVTEGGHPHVSSEIGVRTRPRIPADMVVDAGAADTVNLSSPFVRKHDLLELARKKPAGAPNTMAGSEKEFFAQTSVRGRLDRITLGRFELTSVPMNLMVATTGAYGSESFSGTIGEGILRRFKTTYDYPRNTIYLEPNADFAKPFPGRKTFGATFLAEGPDYTVFKVTGIRKDSAAEAAGLKTADVIAAVDGKPAGEMHLAELRRALTIEDSRHVLVVKRGEERLELDVTVKLVSLDE